MKTKKLLEILLTTCFLTVIFAACQQTGQTDLNPTPNAQTNQFTIQKSWSSVVPQNSSPLRFFQARWRNDNEVYLSGDAAVLWSVDTFAQRFYGRNLDRTLPGLHRVSKLRFLGYFNAQWNAKWNPQRTQLLSNDFLWDSESVEVLNSNGYSIPSNIFYNISYDLTSGDRKSYYVSDWSPNGQKIALGKSVYTSNIQLNVSILDLQNQSDFKTFQFDGVQLSSINWISENQILATLYKTIVIGKSNLFFEILNVDTGLIEKLVEKSDLVSVDNLFNTFKSEEMISQNLTKLVYTTTDLTVSKMYLSVLSTQDLILRNKIEVCFYPTNFR